MNNQEVVQKLVKLAKELVAMGKKKFNVQFNVGKAKYVVNYHDGKKMHKDGSPFYDMAIFSDKKQFVDFQKHLKSEGYTEER